MKAQLVNYDQYRALIEGFSSHMWDWYTGTIIWKTQNPWTSMRGQMYDYYLDPNACLFGLRKGSEMLHVMCNPVTKRSMIVNNGFEQVNDMMFVARYYDIEGNETILTQEIAYIEPSDAKMLLPLQGMIGDKLDMDGGFLYLQLLDRQGKLLSDNFYWYPNAEGKYTGLNKMKKADIKIASKTLSSGKMEVSVTNPKGGAVAFFNRVSLVDSKTGERVLPAFYSDNYISVVPGESKTVTVEFTPQQGVTPKIEVSGWNTDKK